MQEPGRLRNPCCNPPLSLQNPGVTSLWQHNPPRLAVVLSVLPAAFGLICWFAARKMLRILEQSDVGRYRLDFFPDHWVTLIHAGWLLGIIPMAWGIVATLRADVETGIASLQERDALVGKVLAVVVILGAFVTLLLAIDLAFGPPVGPMQPIDGLQ